MSLEQRANEYRLKASDYTERVSELLECPDPDDPLWVREMERIREFGNELLEEAELIRKMMMQ